MMTTLTPWLESSNFVGRYRALYARNTTAASTPLASIPSPVQSRLNAMNLTWTDLPMLAQEAVLWDMGFVRRNDGSNMVQQVYTTCASNGNTGLSMENIMIPLNSILKVESNSSVIVCGDYSRHDTASNIEWSMYAKCAIEMHPSNAGNTSAWSQDEMNNAVAPTLRVARHEYFDNDEAMSTFFSIHSVPDAFNGEWAQRTCPSDRLGSLIIPCKTFNQTNDMCIPTSSVSMTEWLVELSRAKIESRSKLPTPQPTTSSSPTGTILGVVVAVLAAIAIAVGVFLYRKRRQKKAQQSSVTYLPFGSTPSRESDHVKERSDPPDQYDYIHSKSQKLNTFQRDDYLKTLRIPYASIQTTRILSKGAYGEVWLGALEGEVVAVKKILDSKRNDNTELECFADEIRLMASLHHPHIVLFKGFALDSFQNMCCVVEYMRNGDLGSYLAEHHPTTLNWHEKLVLAVGIARALAYLHARTPKIIHRDLKAKNILVSDDLQAKLSDFGISRERSTNETMTAGVGTIYWTAPEILNGDRYSELADVYSFGCVLNELDTHTIPYAHLKDVAPMTIIQQVTSSGLRPEFTPRCPKLVRDLADLCLVASPSDRPTAARIVEMIETWKGWR